MHQSCFTYWLTPTVDSDRSLRLYRFWVPLQPDVIDMEGQYLVHLT